MPVTDSHRCYATRLPQWIRCRDAFEGTDAVKVKGTTYLPKLSGQKPAEYDAYLKRATWYGATARTVLGLTGSVMRKPPVLEVPENLETHFEDVTRTNVSLTAFCSALIQEVLNVGRTGILLDMPKQEIVGSPRPHWVKYDAEQILNWRTEMIDGVKTLTLVVLCEEYEDLASDVFSHECKNQYRVLLLENGVYTVRLYRKTPTHDYMVTEEIIPRVRGGTIPYIPFVFVNPLNLEADPDKPPLLDMVDLNYSHYRTSADLEHGRHFTALPTPYVIGASKETSLKIGSSTAWAIPQAEAKVGMLEFSGGGLTTLERAAEHKERQMAVLGARMLEQQKAQVEATETHAIRLSGEGSLLASIAETISVGLTQIARWHAMWAGSPESTTVKIGLNKDFFGLPLSSGEIAELIKGWQSGAISYATLYYNLQQGEITRPGVEAEEEKSEIDAEMPKLSLDDEGNPIPEGEEGEAKDEGGEKKPFGGGPPAAKKPPFGVKPPAVPTRGMQPRPSPRVPA